MLTPDELKKLAVLYHVNAVPLFVMAGYLDETDLEDYQMGFQRAGLLNNAERECIQAQINLLTKERTPAEITTR